MITSRPSPSGPRYTTAPFGRGPGAPVVADLRLPILSCSAVDPPVIDRPLPARARFGGTSARHRLPALLAVALLASLVGLMLGLGQAAADGEPTPTGRFSWPLPPPHQVLRPFQPPATRYGPGHRGVDLAGSIGEPVLAAGGGLVVFAGPIGGCDLISVEHPGGLRTTYEPVDPAVHVGQSVTREQVIGHLLAARPTCPQEVTAGARLPPVFLYWGAHRDSVYLDPVRLVEAGRIRLLPWDGHR